MYKNLTLSSLMTYNNDKEITSLYSQLKKAKLLVPRTKNKNHPCNTNIFSIVLLPMTDREKIKAAISLLKKLQRMVGFFMKKEISELISQLEEQDLNQELNEPLKKEIIH